MDYSISYKKNKKRGKATITIKGKGNYILLAKWDNMPTNPDTFADVSTYDNGGSNILNGSFSGGLDVKYSSNRDPHLSASKEVELKKGTLLGSEFKVK